MRIWKMNGAGNAFAVFDARDSKFAPSEAQLREIAASMKADQIMAIENYLRADAFLRFWNADCSEVKACQRGYGLAPLRLGRYSPLRKNGCSRRGREDWTNG